MATKFRRVREKMAPERQERIRKRTQELLAELPLQELRQALERDCPGRCLQRASTESARCGANAKTALELAACP